MRFTRLPVLAATLWLLTIPPGVHAEVITLLDGTVIEAGKVWEKDGLIHFYLEGYDGIVITYDKDIVDKIEGGAWTGKKLRPDGPDEPQAADSAPQKPVPAAPSTPPESPANDSPKQPSAAETAKSIPATTPNASSSAQPTQPPDKVHQGTVKPAEKSVTPSKAAAVKAAPAQPQKSAQNSERKAVTPPPMESESIIPGVDKTEISEVAGLQFYNPRRPYKYWAGPESKHRTFDEAVAALAAKFERPPEWVAERLGSSNDLQQIYRNLSQPGLQLDVGAPPEKKPAIKFYDPRRSYKYWTGETERHRTLEDALDSLGRHYDRSAEWVKENIGETNDLAEIHQNLSESKAAETGP